jgi:hypothetical protein
VDLLLVAMALSHKAEMELLLLLVAEVVAEVISVEVVVDLDATHLPVAEDQAMQTQH